MLSGFDRLVFRGSLRALAHHLGMKSYFWAMQVLLKGFASHAVTSLDELTARLCRPTKRHGRLVRTLNPNAPTDATLLNVISRGEFTINGFRNRDLRRRLFIIPASKSEQTRQAAAVSRKLALLRAHHLIRKVPQHTAITSPTQAGSLSPH